MASSPQSSSYGPRTHGGMRWAVVGRFRAGATATTHGGRCFRLQMCLGHDGHQVLQHSLAVCIVSCIPAAAACAKFVAAREQAATGNGQHPAVYCATLSINGTPLNDL